MQGLTSRELPATLQSEVLFEEELVCAVDKESSYRKKLSLAQYIAANHVCISVLKNQQTVPDIAVAKFGSARRCAVTIPHFSVGSRYGSRNLARLHPAPEAGGGPRQSTAKNISLSPGRVHKLSYLMI